MISYVDKEGNVLDKVIGQSLDAQEVRKAGTEKMGHVHSLKVYTKVPLKQCWDRTGKGPIRVRWLDINNGDEVKKE